MDSMYSPFSELHPIFICQSQPRSMKYAHHTRFIQVPAEKNIPKHPRKHDEKPMGFPVSCGFRQIPPRHPRHPGPRALRSDRSKESRVPWPPEKGEWVGWKNTGYTEKQIQDVLLPIQNISYITHYIYIYVYIYIYIGVIWVLWVMNYWKHKIGILEKTLGIHVFLKSSFLFLAFLTGESTSEEFAHQYKLYIYILYKYIYMLY